MTPKDIALEELDKIKFNREKRYGDAESWHLDADHVLTRLLDELGYSEVTDKWREVPKWYS